MTIGPVQPYSLDMGKTKRTAIPTTRTAYMLVRDATGEVLREALDFEVAAARASGHAWLPYALHCPQGTIPCYIEQRVLPLAPERA